MAYIVEADGTRIFYGRDHVSTNEANEVEAYRKEIDFLKPYGPVDMAFLRIRGHFANDYEPYLYLIDKLSPKVVYLTGGEGNPNEYPKCSEILKPRNISVQYPEGKLLGDRFHYLMQK